ncbi:MAG: 23S rRNA (uracil(1939)-C(5))-methyltransferase RlmD, partial [Myxococcales bacterium]|nr:23S rRNA (uracil(1939)-C(5))-methyltransferase RlmD [Myxococcales bacterium]
GVVENINQRKQNTILGEETNTLCGKPYLREEIDGLLFNTSLASFFQVNLHAAKILYQIALNFAQLTKNSIVLDACCGIGTMTLLASRLCKEVIGVECVPQAVVDAQENARINNIHNARFITAKIEDKTELFQGIDCALLNPPRKGLDQKVCQALDTFGPKRLVYISCNPHTLARDAQLLTRYSLKKIQPVDMFPQTMHVESVALFERI